MTLKPHRKLTTFSRVSIGYKQIPSTSEASLAFSTGIIAFFIPILTKPETNGKTPLTGFIFPSRDNSPIKAYSPKFLFSISSKEAIIPTAMGKSK